MLNDLSADLKKSICNIQFAFVKSVIFTKQNGAIVNVNC